MTPTGPADAPDRRDVAMIDRMVELAATQARLEAELAATICEFIDLRRAEPVDDIAADKGKVVPGEFAADEIAAALTWSTSRVTTTASRFRRLRMDLPHTAALWQSGRIDGFKAGKVVEAANRLTWPESVATLDAATAERATSQTTTQLQQWLNRRVARLEPDQAERRHRRAHADRRVSTRTEPDGMGSLWAMAGAADLAAIDYRLTDLARKLGSDDPRSMDQRRTDLFVDILTGRDDADSAGSAGSSAVAVVVPVQSLLGVDDAPGELADRSATIPASLAREIAARPGTVFHRLLTDERGELLDVAQLGRFPSDLLGFAVNVRDGSCAWPTCSTPASKCDHDHSQPAPDGPTAARNLGPACRRHHRARTHADFDLQQPDPGVFVWRTPTGHRYLAESELLPVGQWPRPVVIDPLPPIGDRDDADATDPPLWESSVRDLLEPRAGPEPLLAREAAALAAAL